MACRERDPPPRNETLLRSISSLQSLTPPLLSMPFLRSLTTLGSSGSLSGSAILPASGTWEPARKLSMARGRLEGLDPLTLLLSDLENNVGVKREGAPLLAAYKKVRGGGEGGEGKRETGRLRANDC